MTSALFFLGAFPLITVSPKSLSNMVAYNDNDDDDDDDDGGGNDRGDVDSDDDNTCFLTNTIGRFFFSS